MKHRISVLANDGEQYEVNEFLRLGLTKDDAVGIVVQNEIIGLIMSLDEWECPWGCMNKIVTKAQNEAEALQEISGLGFTNQIWVANEDNDCAANKCAKYDCGHLTWYLPCLMELGMVCAHKDEINELLASLNLPKLQDDYYWSSSEGSQTYAWVVGFSDGGLGNWGGKYGSYRLRACAAFTPLASHCEHLNDASGEASDLTDKQLLAMLRDRGYTGKITKEINI